MRKTSTLAALIALLSALAIAPATADAPEVIDLLVVTETAGYRHSSIPLGVQMLEDMAENESLAGVDFTVTEAANSLGNGPLPMAPTIPFLNRNISHEIANAQGGPGFFSDEGLAAYDVVVFISTTGDFLNADEQAAFERYIRAGGGYVGIHAAADAEYQWPWYGDLVGGWFRGHPAIQEAAIDVVQDTGQASTAHLPARWTRTDEWYSYLQNPRSYPCNTDATKQCGVRVLATLDEASYDEGSHTMGDHPITWCNEWEGGRAWYTGLGHTDASYTESDFIQLVTGGILTAANIPGLAESVDFAASGLDFDCEPAAE